MSAGSRGWSGRSVRTKTTPWSSGAGCTRSVHEAPVWSPTPESEKGSRMVLCLRVKRSDAPSARAGCPAYPHLGSLRRELGVQALDDRLRDVERVVVAEHRPRGHDDVEIRLDVGICRDEQHHRREALLYAVGLRLLADLAVDERVLLPLLGVELPRPHLLVHVERVLGEVDRTGERDVLVGPRVQRVQLVRVLRDLVRARLEPRDERVALGLELLVHVLLLAVGLEHGLDVDEPEPRRRRAVLAERAGSDAGADRSGEERRENGAGHVESPRRGGPQKSRAIENDSTCVSSPLRSRIGKPKSRAMGVEPKIGILMRNPNPTETRMSSQNEP